MVKHYDFNPFLFPSTFPSPSSSLPSSPSSSSSAPPSSFSSPSSRSLNSPFRLHSLSSSSFFQPSDAASAADPPAVTGRCVACKTLGQRCHDNCRLAADFTSSETHKYDVVDKVFGAANIAKFLQQESSNSFSYIPMLLVLKDRTREVEFEPFAETHLRSSSGILPLSADPCSSSAAEVVRITTTPRYFEKSREEIAAVKIQTTFRGYLARMALRALRGSVNLKTLIPRQSVKRQVTSTLPAMHTFARVQFQIRATRIRMSEENQALQRKQEKGSEKIGASQIGEQWDDSVQSKEQLEASILRKQEAVMRRQRALAYAFSHQKTWKNSPRYSRSDASHAIKPLPRGLKHNQPPTRQSPSMPLSKEPAMTSVTGKTKQLSPRGCVWGHDNDSRSLFSSQFEPYRRHRIAGSSVRDDESLASSPSAPSYMVPTKSAKAKSHLPSLSRLDKNGIPQKASPMGSTKKRLSSSGSFSGPRRHSGPPRMDSFAANNKKENVINGESST